MSIIKLISQGKAYDELFSTADYIQTNDGVGIYPAYENALRDISSSTYIVHTGYTEGFFIMNVPTGQIRSSFLIPKTTLPQNTEYTIYFSSSIPLNKLVIEEAVSPFTKYYNAQQQETFNINVTEDNTTSFYMYPEVTDLNKNIEIRYTIVPKGYPKLQEWSGSGLNATLSGLEKSISYQFKGYTISSGLLQTILAVKYNNIERIGLQRFSSSDDIRIRIATDLVGGTPVFVTIKNNPVMTFSLDGVVLSVYENKDLIETVVVEWNTLVDNIQIVQATFENVSYSISSLFSSTEESTGYSQNSEPTIQPTCKLGLTGSEIDLPKESRTQSSINRVVKELESESANATLHTQYIANKDRMAISYEIISEENRKIIQDIEALQWQNNARLNYIYNEESGNLITKTVKATVTTGGNKLQKDRYFDTGLTIELKE
jgi:hypothetical protein